MKSRPMAIYEYKGKRFALPVGGQITGVFTGWQVGDIPNWDFAPPTIVRRADGSAVYVKRVYYKTYDWCPEMS